MRIRTLKVSEDKKCRYCFCGSARDCVSENVFLFPGVVYSAPQSVIFTWENVGIALVRVHRIALSERVFLFPGVVYCAPQGVIFTWENVHNLDPLLLDKVFKELPDTELCERNLFTNLNLSILILFKNSASYFSKFYVTFLIATN